MKRSGFTLLEVMISVAFIGIALAAVIRAQGQGISLSEEARFMSRAVFLASTALSEAESDSDLEAGIKEGEFEEPLDFISWKREVVPMAGFQGLYKINILVWDSGVEAGRRISLQGFAYREQVF